MRNNRVPFVLLLSAVLLSAVIAGFLFQSKIRSIHGLRTSLAAEMKGPASARGGMADTGLLKNLFPPESNITEFLEDMHGIAKRNGIKELFFEQKSREAVAPDSGRAVRARPATAEEVVALYRFPVRVSFRSEYRGMAEFIRELQSGGRLVTIENLHARRDKGFLLTELTVVIYATGEK